MEQKWSQIQINKEPPEASEIVDLDGFTSKILRRKDISDWEKADMLASSLERFLSLRPRGLGQQNPLQGTPAVNAVMQNKAPAEMAEESVWPMLKTPALPAPVGREKRKANNDLPRQKREKKDKIIGRKIPVLPPLVGKEKRKSTTEIATPKRKIVQAEEELWTEDEDEVSENRRTPERPPLVGREKRKATTTRKETKKRPILLSLKHNADGTHQQTAKRLRTLEPRGPLKRKIEEIEEPSILRNKQQKGGQLNWIYVY